METVRKAAQDGADNLIAAIVEQLAYAGEQAVNTARSLPSPPATLYMDANGEYKRNVEPHQPNYIDWSANLRSSIGYAVIVDGMPVTVSDFQPVTGKDGKLGTDGATDGRKFAVSLAGEFPTGIVLVVVAGMKYAKYVTARGYDVLDSAEANSRKIVPELIRQLFEA